MFLRIFFVQINLRNDRYAESYHRDFFRNYADKKPLRECAGKEDHNTASVGGLVMIPVVALYHYYQGSSRSTTIERCLEHLRLTHQSHLLEEHAKVYLELYISLLENPIHPVPRETLVDLVDKACKSLPDAFDLKRLLQQFPELNDPKVDAKVVGRMFSPACYIQDSLPSLLYFAGKYADPKIVPGLLANANVGGDNCHRGSVLGALLGAAFGESGIDKYWKEGLVAHEQISDEITRFEGTISGKKD
jgi:ADP-ribosyl-[dinitrogen reductase] hydrolase